MTERRAALRVRALALTTALCIGLTGCGLQSANDDQPRHRSGPARLVEPVRDDSVQYAYPAADADPKQNYGRLYLPHGIHPKQSVPIVVLIHGGGWKNRSSAGYMAEIARSLQSAGLAVWNIEYRRVGSGGGWPTTFTDVGSAVDYLPALERTAPALNPNNVIFVGHSAGGQLAAWAATRATLPQGAPGVTWPAGGRPAVVPKAFVSLAGVLDMTTSSRLNDHVKGVLGGMPTQVPDRYLYANPIQRIDPAMTSVAIHGTRDVVVPYRESANFVADSRALGGRSLLIKLDGAGHASPVSARSRWWPTIERAIVVLATDGFDALAANPPQSPN